MLAENVFFLPTWLGAAFIKLQQSLCSRTCLFSEVVPPFKAPIPHLIEHNFSAFKEAPSVMEASLLTSLCSPPHCQHSFLFLLLSLQPDKHVTQFPQPQLSLASQAPSRV